MYSQNTLLIGNRIFSFISFMAQNHMDRDPDKIYVEEKVRYHTLTQKILSKLPGI